MIRLAPGCLRGGDIDGREVVGAGVEGSVGLLVVESGPAFQRGCCNVAASEVAEVDAAEVDQSDPVAALAAGEVFRARTPRHRPAVAHARRRGIGEIASCAVLLVDGRGRIAVDHLRLVDDHQRAAAALRGVELVDLHSEVGGVDDADRTVARKNPDLAVAGVDDLAFELDAAATHRDFHHLEAAGSGVEEHGEAAVGRRRLVEQEAPGKALPQLGIYFRGGVGAQVQRVAVPAALHDAVDVDDVRADEDPLPGQADVGRHLIEHRGDFATARLANTARRDAVDRPGGHPIPLRRRLSGHGVLRDPVHVDVATGDGGYPLTDHRTQVDDVAGPGCVGLEGDVTAEVAHADAAFTRAEYRDVGPVVAVAVGDREHVQRVAYRDRRLREAAGRRRRQLGERSRPQHEGRIDP